MIHLDTCALIRALVPDTPEDRKVRAWLRAGERLVMSVVAWTEFLAGPVTEPQGALAARVIVAREPFTEEDARRAARLFDATGRQRGSLLDCMIAATAIRCEAPLSTANRADFTRFTDHGLALAE
ncbi:MAG: PIN domain-containing protein [Planctomycetes bacterium]|jgi:predicted nucleic acid-binding protein|nr:PIN domain-containing protein [Planctomycetota bacterium]